MKRHTKIILYVLAGLAVVYGCAVGALYVFQRNLTYFPDSSPVSPEEFNRPDVREVALETRQGINLYAWYVPGGLDRPVFLLNHGNAGNVGTTLQWYQVLQDLGYPLFIVGYPGYGRSGGKPTERGLVEAALLAYDYLVGEGVKSSDIVIYGVSLGTAVAVQLAAMRPARALILEAPMDSVQAMAEARYPFVPIKRLIKDTFISIDYIGRVDEPLLVIHGDEDKTVPFSNGKALFDAANEPKVFHAVEGGEHNNLYEYPIVPVLQRFLEANP